MRLMSRTLVPVDVRAPEEPEFHESSEGHVVFPGRQKGSMFVMAIFASKSRPPGFVRSVTISYNQQWLTHVLYNAYLPFNYSFITDTHVFLCDDRSYLDIIDLYE